MARHEAEAGKAANGRLAKAGAGAFMLLAVMLLTSSLLQAGAGHTGGSDNRSPPSSAAR